MRDPQHELFVQRLKRVNRTNRRGGGFEAAGTLGRSYYTAQARRRSVWRPAFVAAAGFLCVKAVMLSHIGTEAYQARVDEMRQGSATQAVGAFVMQMDPATVWMSALIVTALKPEA